MQESTARQNLPVNLPISTPIDLVSRMSVILGAVKLEQPKVKLRIIKGEDSQIMAPIGLRSQDARNEKNGLETQKKGPKGLISFLNAYCDSIDKDIDQILNC